MEFGTANLRGAAMEKRVEDSGADRDAPDRPKADRADAPQGDARRAPAARPLNVFAAQRIQASAGNRALAGMIAQRRTTAPGR